MALQTIMSTRAKPFLKWAGGKTQLLPVIDSFLPKSFSRERGVTYIEPFVGAGAMLFFMLQKYPNIKRAVINDINPHLVKAYSVIKNQPQALIEFLSILQKDYRQLTNYDVQKEFYLKIRNRFNSEVLTDVEEAAFMIFMNRTCFNGLYRENSGGKFNVPFGRYLNPTICDEALIMADSELLQKVEILKGDFSKTIDYVEGYTFFYFDPPYRPLNRTSNFNSYVRKTFDDNEQIRVKEFFSTVSKRGCFAMLSNSDGMGQDTEDAFFDELYQDFIIERVLAKRQINSRPAKRGALTELLIRNYVEHQGKVANGS